MTSCTCTLPMDAANVQLILHEYVNITAQGYFNGYRGTASIAATNQDGQDDRDRYDAVKVTIPPETGGAIASSPDLVGPTPDSALARVLGILTIRQGERETCLLPIMFFRAVQKRQHNRLFAEHVTSPFKHLFYASPHLQWIALYPLVTLRAPALSVAVPAHTNCFILFSAQYLSRGLWEKHRVRRLQWDGIPCSVWTSRNRKPGEPDAGAAEGKPCSTRVHGGGPGTHFPFVAAATALKSKARLFKCLQNLRGCCQRQYTLLSDLLPFTGTLLAASAM